MKTSGIAESAANDLQIIFNKDRIIAGNDRDQFIKTHLEPGKMVKFKLYKPSSTNKSLEFVRSVDCVPLPSSRNRNLLTGQDVILDVTVHAGGLKTYKARPEDMERFGSFIIDPNFSYKVTQGTEIDLSRPMGISLYNMILFNPYIAPNLQYAESNSGEFMFYMVDSTVEATVINQGASKILTALKLLSDSPMEKVLDVARNLGIVVLGRNFTEIQAMLNSIVLGETKSKINIDMIIDAFSDKLSQQKSFVKNCVEHALIVEKGGIFYYRETSLGTSMEQVVAYLNDSANRQTKLGLESQLKELNK